LAAGVDGYHLKDQPLNDLQLALQRVLDGERWISTPLLNKLVNQAEPESKSRPLTDRQRDLLLLLQQGLDNRAIAKKMNLSVKTVENHLTRLYRRLNVQSRLEAVNFSIQHPEVIGPLSQMIGKSSLVEITTAQKLVTILVVDDNERYRSQLKHMIAKVSPMATIYEAKNTAVAVHLAQRFLPQLILVDVVLGDEDGIRCARRIKAISAKSRIVLISAYPDREFHRLGLQAGAVAFLDKKDLDLPTLRQVIEDIIE